VRGAVGSARLPGRRLAAPGRRPATLAVEPTAFAIPRRRHAVVDTQAETIKRYRDRLAEAKEYL
jgi:hypothetical protein